MRMLTIETGDLAFFRLSQLQWKSTKHCDHRPPQFSGTTSYNHFTVLIWWADFLHNAKVNYEVMSGKITNIIISFRSAQGYGFAVKTGFLKCAAPCG